MFDSAMQTILTVGVPFLTVGAAWGGVKMGLNGMGKRVDQIDKRGQRLEDKVDILGERVARVETKLES
jgi:hypothetical protein